MSKGTIACLGCLGYIALYFAIGALTAWLIEWAWNLVMPLLFHLPSIDFAVACAIYVIGSLVVAGIKSIVSAGRS